MRSDGRSDGCSDAAAFPFGRVFVTGVGRGWRVVDGGGEGGVETASCPGWELVFPAVGEVVDHRGAQRVGEDHVERAGHADDDVGVAGAQDVPADEAADEDLVGVVVDDDEPAVGELGPPCGDLVDGDAVGEFRPDAGAVRDDAAQRQVRLGEQQHEQPLGAGGEALPVGVAPDGGDELGVATRHERLLPGEVGFVAGRGRGGGSRCDAVGW
jgi:hypothetical protein